MITSNLIPGKAKCQGLTMRTRGHWTADLPCDKRATKVVDGVALCGNCARKALRTKQLAETAALDTSTTIEQKAQMDKEPFNRKHIANKRCTAALQHLRAAQEMLDAACRDLSALVGANTVWRNVRKLSEGVHNVVEDIDNAYREIEHPYALDHEPTDLDENPHAGCGLNPVLSPTTAWPEPPIPRCGYIVETVIKQIETPCGNPLPCRKHQ